MGARTVRCFDFSRFFRALPLFPPCVTENALGIIPATHALWRTSPPSHGRGHQPCFGLHDRAKHGCCSGLELPDRVPRPPKNVEAIRDAQAHVPGSGGRRRSPGPRTYSRAAHPQVTPRVVPLPSLPGGILKGNAVDSDRSAAHGFRRTDTAS